MNEQNRQFFGFTADGERADLLTLRCGRLTCRILTYGAAIQSLFVPDRQGKPVDVVLGYDTLPPYETLDGYLGAVVGRFANRIAGGHFSLDGQDYSLACNNGPHHLHGGVRGYSHRVWPVQQQSGNSATLSLDSPDGEEGYPGHVQLQVTYTLTDAALDMTLQAVTDRATPLNLTNHSYFNLSGQGSALEHLVQLHASHYTPADETSIPDGTIAPVDGTAMDLRRPTRLRDAIAVPCQQLLWGRGYDHNYVIDGPAGVLRPAALLWAEDTGIRLEVATTQPGMQFYSANWLTDRTGKAGALYAPRCAICVETQHYPDTPNHPSFPSCILRPGVQFLERTEYRFSIQER